MPIVNITKPVTKPTETISTNYTLVLGDKDRVKVATNSSGTLQITIPTNANVPFVIGTQIGFIRQGAGKVEFLNTGITLNSIDSKRFIKGINGTAALIKTGENTWTLAGSLEVS